METPKLEVREVGSHGKTWSLDRRVPIALVITTAVQLLVFAWFAIGPPAHRDDQDERTLSIVAETDMAGRDGTGIVDTMVRLEDALDKIYSALIRLESKLTRHLDDGR